MPIDSSEVESRPVKGNFNSNVRVISLYDGRKVGYVNKERFAHGRCIISVLDRFDGCSLLDKKGSPWVIFVVDRVEKIKTLSSN